MKYLVIAFDTEDYVHEYAANGVLRDAKLLTELAVDNADPLGERL